MFEEEPSLQLQRLIETTLKLDKDGNNEPDESERRRRRRDMRHGERKLKYHVKINISCVKHFKYFIVLNAKQSLEQLYRNL